MENMFLFRNINNDFCGSGNKESRENKLFLVKRLVSGLGGNLTFQFGLVKHMAKRPLLRQRDHPGKVGST